MKPILIESDVNSKEQEISCENIEASEPLFTGWQTYIDVVEPGTEKVIRVSLTDATFSITGI